MRFPESWREVRLGDILYRVEAKVDPQRAIALTHFYVGLEHIESHTGRLLREAEDVTDSTDILSIKTAFQKGDLLYGKLRPNLNKVHLADQNGICSTDIWALRASDELNPEFGLHFLRSPAIHVRTSQLATGANLPRVSAESFDRISFPLPTLPEQQRIVDVLRQAEAATQDQKYRRQKLDLMINAALDRLVLAVDVVNWVPLGEVVETRYGTSVSADASVDSGTPVLRIPNVMGGEVDMTDMKYVELPQAELKRLRLAETDVLIVRSNGNPEYVGRSAPITEDIVRSPMVYASYLIRLRTDAEQLLPEYLSAFLNSAFGRAAMRNAIRTTAGQSNLSGENLTKVRLPIPSLAEQEQFRKFWLEVKALRQLISQSEHTTEELRSALRIYALSGELTEDWRLQNREEIAAAAAARDGLLRDRGAMFASRPVTTEPLAPVAKDSQRPARQWLIAELSEFQRQVLAAFSTYPEHPLLVEDADVFARFCDDENVLELLKYFGPSLNNRIRRTLSQLSSLGLIAKVTLPKQNPQTGERDYLKAFRPLREDEYTKMADVKTLRRALPSGDAAVNYYFTVVLDYETSEHAGAGGMFQVAALSDEDDKNRTDLVDQGKHYAALDELANDIARRLGVRADQIELEE